MAGAGLTFKEIAEVITSARGGRTTCGYIATKLRRAATFVQRALDEMQSEGMVAEFSLPRRCYELTGKDVPPDRGIESLQGAVHGPRKARTFVHADDDVDAYEIRDDGRTYSQTDIEIEQRNNAERLWRERMGRNRWRDDPRAVAQRVRREFLYGAAG